MKRVAVIGANGYIGKHIVNYLERYEASIDTYDVAKETNLPHYHAVDLTDMDSVKSIDLNVDYIFMFAGLTGTYAGFDHYTTYQMVNETGLLNLLNAIRQSEYRPKVIFPSTRLVYKGVDKPLDEEDEKETKTIYAVNKMACEGYLQAYHDSFDIPYAVFRICIPYGNMFSSDYSFGTVGFFINQAKTKHQISLYGGGEVKRTFTHIEDLCFQIVEGAFAEGSDRQVYNVGGETLSLREAAEIIARRFDAKVVATPWPERDLRIESNHTYFSDRKIADLIMLPAYKRLAEFSEVL